MLMLKMARRLTMACLLALGAPLAASAAPGLPEGLPRLPDLNERILSDDLTGLALAGYDAVAYHIAGQALAGDARYEAQWKDAVWRFTSEANRQAFLADPEAFAPRYNGYDATGVARKRPVQADPGLFAIVEGRLYLFRTAGDRLVFLDHKELIRKADAGWPEVERQLVR